MNSATVIEAASPTRRMGTSTREFSRPELRAASELAALIEHGLCDRVVRLESERPRNPRISLRQVRTTEASSAGGRGSRSGREKGLKHPDRGRCRQRDLGMDGELAPTIDVTRGA